MMLTERSGLLVVRPGDYLDVHFKREVVPVVTARIAEGLRCVLFDLEAVELINSYGLSALLTLFDELGRVGGTLAFCAVRAPMVDKALQISGLAVFCAEHLYETEAAAVRALGGD